MRDAKEQAILSKSEEKFRILFESSRDAIMILEPPSWKFTSCNLAAVQLFGAKNKAEFVSKGPWDVSPEFQPDGTPSPEKAKKMIQKAMDEGVNFFEWTHKRINGNDFFTDVLLTRVEIEKGKPFLQATVRDITDQKQIAEDLKNANMAVQNVLNDLQVEKEALAHAKARDDAILVNIGDGLVAVGKDGNIVLVDRAFETILGWKESEIQGKFLSQVMPMVDEMGKPVPESERLISKTIKEQDFAVRSATTYYKRKDGTFFPAVLKVSPIIVGKNFIGAVEIFRDIAKEKKVEKLRTDFLALASHQLRTPLSGTKWLIETMQRGVLGKMTQQQKDYLSQLYEINERMIRLVSDMLNVLRLESGVVPIKQEAVSVLKLYNDLILMAKLAAKEKGWIVLRNLLTNKKDVMVETDVQILRNILDCFISNAINYSTSGQEIVLDAREEKAFVIFSVKDSGIGIPKEEQEHIFERFYRASNAKAVRPGGTGLGLYTALMLAEKISGKLSFESGEGKGTTFYLRVPTSRVNIKTYEENINR